MLRSSVLVASLLLAGSAGCGAGSTDLEAGASGRFAIHVTGGDEVCGDADLLELDDGTCRQAESTFGEDILATTGHTVSDGRVALRLTEEGSQSLAAAVAANDSEHWIVFTWDGTVIDWFPANFRSVPSTVLLSPTDAALPELVAHIGATEVAFVEEQPLPSDLCQEGNYPDGQMLSSDPLAGPIVTSAGEVVAVLDKLGAPTSPWDSLPQAAPVSICKIRLPVDARNLDEDCYEALDIYLVGEINGQFVTQQTPLLCF